MRLVWEYHSTDGYTYSCNIPTTFEYSSPEEFCFKVWEMIEEAKNTQEYPTINLLGIEYIPVAELEGIENQVFTLEEWFEKEKGVI